MDAQGRTAFELQDKTGLFAWFCQSPKHGSPFITMNSSSKHALLSSHQRPPNGGIF